MNIVQKFKQGLQKSSSYLTTHIIDSLKSNKISDETIDEIESILISADIGLEVTNQLIKKIKLSRNIQVKNNNLIFELLAAEITSILKESEKPFLNQNILNPNVLIFVGVNGSGKTTTIGKLIYRLKDKNKILVVACDTFRAAAVEQLKEWTVKQKADFYQGAIKQAIEKLDQMTIEYEEKFCNNIFD